MVAKVATLQEIETHWSIDDLAAAGEALDLQSAADLEATKRTP